MGCNVSNEMAEQWRKNKEIDQELKQQKQEDGKIIKLLLLGNFSLNLTLNSKLWRNIYSETPCPQAKAQAGTRGKGDFWAVWVTLSA